MEVKLLFPIAELAYSRVNFTSKFFRSFISKHASYHNKSWEMESEDEDSWHGSRPSYGNKRSNNFQRDRPRYNNRSDSYGRSNQNSYNNDFGGRLSQPNWDNVELPPFEKNFYSPSESVSGRTPEEIEKFRKSHNMSLIGTNIPNPIQEFSDYNFPKEVLNIISDKGFTTPTPIQAQGWPIALSGRDLIGIGQTGSGKTLGYILPSLIHIQNQAPLQSRDGPIALVMAPTRELVQQIHQVSQEASGHARMNTACLFGGASKNVQAGHLLRKPSLCIATPGRLLDFLEMGVTNLKRCTYLVLDEADRMLDMGFEPQIRKVLSQIRPDRQTLMWSATWPRDVEELASDFLSDFVQLNVGSVELVANPNIQQQVEVCGSFEKQERFIEKMKEETREIQSKILIFAQTKSQVDYLAKMLYREGIKARGIHGDHSQNSRDNTLHGFRAGRYSCLVATDVASRGLDVDDISLVVNYDFPDSIEDYIHRIGRTGRAGKEGRAFSLFTERNAGMARELIRVLKQAKHEVPDDLINMAEQSRGFAGNKRRFGGNNRYKQRDNYFRSRY